MSSRFSKQQCQMQYRWDQTYHRIEFGMALARYMGIPITNQPLNSMLQDERGQGNWDHGILYLPDNKQSELFHEIGHWVEGRSRGALRAKNYGLRFDEPSPKLDLTAEEFAQVIEWVILQCADVATQRLNDVLFSEIRDQKFRRDRKETEQ